jgi:hypothetical protein
MVLKKLLILPIAFLFVLLAFSPVYGLNFSQSAPHSNTFDQPQQSIVPQITPPSYHPVLLECGKDVRQQESMKITSEETYNVTFTERCLPSGTQWYVNITNSTCHVFSKCSGSTTISFNLPNGTFKFTNETADKIYRPSSESGHITVKGRALTLNTVAFFRVTYSVIFSEKGLPGGTT